LIVCSGEKEPLLFESYGPWPPSGVQNWPAKNPVQYEFNLYLGIIRILNLLR